MKRFINTVSLCYMKVLVFALLQLANAQHTLRLVGGSTSSEGRVEVFHNNIWGTVCDDSWDINDARVICHQLGYRDAISSPGSARFGAGRGKIWLDDVNCQGDETSIVDCGHRGWGINNCGHSEDASVVCYGPRSGGCSRTMNSTFGDIEVSSTDGYYEICQWTIPSSSISQAVALVSVRELYLVSCSEYVKITDGVGTEVFHHQGCVPFAKENLLDVQFGSSGNISVQVCLGNNQSSVKIKFAVLTNGISSALPLSGWNVAVLMSSHFGFTIQLSALHTYINRTASFYLILVKTPAENLLAVETFPGSATTADITGLRPSTKYRIGVYGVDETGQAYKTSENLASTNDVFCGSRPGADSLIVGGSVARVNSWPWQVMLIRTSGGQLFCGGSLVDPYWVVTAAHCVSGKSPYSIKVKLGVHYRTTRSVGTEQEIRVAQIITHENYNKPFTYSNDIALIELLRPANLGVGIGLVCLPDMRHALPFDNLNKTCWITGWGTLSSGGSQPNALMEAQIPLISKGRCLNSYPGEIDDSMLCAGLDAGGVDTCQGDSGGPLVCEFNGTWFLEGVTSWGYRCTHASKYGVNVYVRDLKAWLTNDIYQTTPPTVLPQNQSVSTLVWCSFDSGLCSGWNQSSSDDFHWTLSSGSTLSASTGPSSGQGGSGKYMYIETSSPRRPGDKAKLVLTVPSNGETSCLSFYYHMYGATVGSLNVYSGNSKVFNISGNQSNNWVMVERNILLNGLVIFEGIAGKSFTGDIAIDSVEVNSERCPVSCNFDNGLCFGCSQSREDVFDWMLYSGYTPSLGTGPSSDHTSGSGKYVYIEASNQATGDNAKLSFTVPRNKSSCCLKFFYHMYGSAMGTLNVFSGNNRIFTKTGNQGNYWKRVIRTVYLSDMVTFEGIVGPSFESDIAIDDVSIVDGSCPGCGGTLNKTSGVLYKANGGEEVDEHCIWKIGKAGVSHAVAIFTLESNCSEHVKLLRPDGYEVFNQGGCNSSYPAVTSLEVPFGDEEHLILDISLEYGWSMVNVKYSIVDQTLYSAQVVPSWNVTIINKTPTSLTVRWSNFPLSIQIQRLLVKYKEKNSNVSLTYHVSNWYNSHHTGNGLKVYMFHEVYVVAVSSVNGTLYSSEAITARTNEGVPSVAPSGLRVSTLHLTELKVQWNPIPQHRVNGRLLGYVVNYQEYPYYRYSTRRVNTNSPDVYMLVLSGLKAAHTYRVWVAGFTSAGTGPQSSKYSVTTGCEGYTNRSFGHLEIGSNRGSSYITCTFLIGRGDINQAVAVIWIQDLYLSYYREYVKITDGNGSLVWQYRYSYSPDLRSFVQVGFGIADNITVQIHLRSSYSRFKLQYGIMTQGLFSALPINWNVTVDNTSRTSMAVHWENLAPLINETVLYYIANAHHGNLSRAAVVSGDLYSASVLGLSTYTEYQVNVIGINSLGQPYNSSNVTALTEEGVPSRAPSYIRMTKVRFDQVKVQWDPLPQQFANGRLLGYTVYFYEYYKSYGLKKTVSTSSPFVNMVILRGLKAATRYQIAVAAFTSKGAGTQSYWQSITTGCGGNLNELFGNFQVGRRSYYSSTLQCNWKIGNAGITQAVALVSLPELSLSYRSYYSEYIKVIDGNGITVISRSSATQKSFREVSFGNSGIITVQIFLRWSYSTFKLQFGILKQESAFPLGNWRVSIDNTSTTSIRFSWQNLQTLVGQQTSHYFIFVKDSYGRGLNEYIVPGNTISHVVSGLTAYSEYRLSVAGVNYSGNAYNSTEITAWTEEGVPSRAPSYIRLSTLQFAEVKVQWNPLSQHYANGRLLGYKVYYREYTSYYYLYYAKSVNTSSANVTMMILRDLKQATRYQIAVTAFTTKGEGRRSSWLLITTGCRRYINQSFGQLQFGPKGYSGSLLCTWSIGNAGIEQAVALMSIQDLYLSSFYEYIKIIDGSGTTLLTRYRYSTTPQKPFAEVSFGNQENITVQINLYHSSSNARLQFGILPQGLQSARLVSSWSLFIDHKTATSMRVSWKNLSALLSQSVLYYINVIKSSSGSIVNGNILQGNTTSDVFYGLSPYMEYRLNVLGVNDKGKVYKSSEATEWTEESAPGRAPSDITFSEVKATQFKVTWSTLPQRFHNGRLLGYRIYFRRSAYYLNPFNTSGVVTRSPNVTWALITGLGPAQRYDVSVAAFTPKGEGPRSSLYYVTTACRVAVNQSYGAINVTHSDYTSLYCSWSIGNAEIPQAIGLFLIQAIDFRYCSYYHSEYFKIFDGNGALKFHQTGCPSSVRGSLVEVPFFASNNITASFNMRRLRSAIKADYLILGKSLHAAQVLYGWNLTVVNITYSSIWIRWANLTSLISRKVGHYVVFLNRRNNSAAFHQVVNGDQLTTEISGLSHLTNYTVEVVGIDSLQKPYKTPSEAIKTANRQSLRLVGGSGSWEGRVEVFHNNIWGTVCDDSWDLHDARVVCRQLGFAGALSAPGSARFGAGSGQIWLDNVACAGSELSLVDCRRSRWGIHNCRHSEDASVICSRAPASSVPCNFDNGLCYGWSQSRSDIFDWTLQRGSTSSLNTGPSSDHTTGKGYYIYIETTARQQGDNAKIQVSVSGNGAAACLVFYYHMYGDTIGTLNVYSGNELVFNVSGNQGNSWIGASKTIHLRHSVTFEGIAGSSYTGDIAIDDVAITSGSCYSPTVLPTNQSIGGCSDLSPNFCSLFAHGNFCVNSFNLSRKYCEKTCGFCGAGCSDRHVVCPGLPNSFCSAHFDWSEQNCRRSCGFCSAGSTLPPSTYQNASTTPTADGSRLQPSTFSPENQDASTTPITDGSTLQPSTFLPENQNASTTPTTDGSTLQPSTDILQKQTPSEQVMRESVMLKVKNMDLTKWDQNMEYSFKKQVAAAATEYCAQVQCYPNQSRQRRSSENVTFTADMVHILPGYPKRSDDSPGVVLLAFYLSLPQRTSESSVVSESILHDIVMGHKENIQTSFGGEISSVDPFPSATEVLKNEESDEGNGGKSKPTNVIIGASVGGGLLLIIIAAVLIGCKKSDRFINFLANREALEETSLTLMLEMEDISEDVSSSPAN